MIITNLTKLQEGQQMPNIATVLKAEIARIARKEANAMAAPIRKPVARFRRDGADLKRRMAALEQEVKRLQAALKAMAPTQPAAAHPDEKAPKAWITGKGIMSLRKGLGLSQSQFARLAGVSDQAVYMWERKPGMLRLRAATMALVLPLRGIGVKQARQMLAEKGKRGKPVARK